MKKEVINTQVEELNKDAEALKTVIEVQKNYRELDTKDYGKVRLYKPTLQDDYDGQIIYAEEFTRLVSSGKFKTQKQWLKLYEETGTWAKEDEQKISALQQDIIAMKAELLHAISVLEEKDTDASRKQVETIQNDLVVANTDFNKLTAQKQSLFTVTAENRAQEKVLVYKLSRSARKEDGSLLWENFKDLEAARQSESVSEIMYAYISFLYGVDQEILSELLNQ